MFVVQVDTKENLKAALALIGEYRHATYALELTPHLNVFTISVEENGELVEMAFQMNWTQANTNICPICTQKIEETGVGEAFCGHLIFNKPKEV